MCFSSELSTNFDENNAAYGECRNKGENRILKLAFPAKIANINSYQIKNEFANVKKCRFSCFPIDISPVCSYHVYNTP